VKDTFFYKKKSLNCNGRLLFLDQPIVMGILNLTPDSFFDGGSYQNEKQLLAKAEQFLSEGATILDLGAYSSKPNANHINEVEELDRLLPAINSIVRQFPKVILSVDTFRSNVAKQAVKHGAAIINDISSGDIDPEMFETIAQLNVPYIMMHMQGTPQNMQSKPNYRNITAEISKYFSAKINKLNKLGVNDIVLDPGFGFGKTTNHNYELFSKMDQLTLFEKPLLIGISRKSMIYKLLETDPENALNGTSALHSVALLKGADILRVHDVKKAIEVVKIVQQLKNS
jgi:dihydropteroate synthase